MSENVVAPTSRNTKGLHGLHRDNFTLLKNVSNKSCMPQNSITYAIYILCLVQSRLHSYLSSGEKRKVPSVSCWGFSGPIPNEIHLDTWVHTLLYQFFFRSSTSRPKTCKRGERSGIVMATTVANLKVSILHLPADSFKRSMKTAGYVCHLLSLISWSAYSSILKMEAICSPKTCRLTFNRLQILYTKNRLTDPKPRFEQGKSWMQVRCVTAALTCLTPV
jgi:hypothetical protein